MYTLARIRAHLLVFFLLITFFLPILALFFGSLRIFENKRAEPMVHIHLGARC